MDNWEKIIRSCGLTDNKTLKLIDATILAVNSHAALFESANVRLITGQIIEGLPNASGNKLFIGQGVKVGYRTTPNAGWIDKVSNEVNPVRITSYDVEETPHYAPDVSPVETSEELILNVNAKTKLIYGTHTLMSLQGYAVKFNNAPLTVADVDVFGNHLEFDSYWRDSAEDEFIECHHTVDLFINQRNYSSGRVTFYPVVRCTQYNKSTGTLLYSGAFSTWGISDPSDIFILPTISSISGLPDYDGQLTPYGYVKNNNLYFYVGYIQDSDPNTIKYVEQFISGGYQAHIYLHGSNSYSVIPIESFEEECYDFAVVKRVEPRI